MSSDIQDPEVSALSEAQADARVSEERVAELRRDLEQAEQRAQQSWARVRKLTGFSIEPFLAPPWLRPRDLKEAKAQIPRGSIQCAQWDDGGRTVRIGLQLGENGPGFWVEVSREELGYHASEHDPRRLRRIGIAEQGESDVEQVARLMDERDAARQSLASLTEHHTQALNDLETGLAERDALQKQVEQAHEALRIIGRPLDSGWTPVAWAQQYRQGADELRQHEMGIADQLRATREERDALQLEVERLGRVKAAAPDVVFESLRIADEENGRLREAMHRVRDDLAEGDVPEVESALARLAEVLG